MKKRYRNSQEIKEALEKHYNRIMEIIDARSEEPEFIEAESDGLIIQTRNMAGIIQKIHSQKQQEKQEVSNEDA